MSGQAGPATSSRLQAHHRPVTVSRPEVGKILGWDKYGGYSCTGSVLDTPSLRLVLTAGHCVFADGVWARTMLFIPDFKNGRRPYGTYVVKTAWVANWWQRDMGEVLDHAFVIHFDADSIIGWTTFHALDIAAVLVEPVTQIGD